MHLDKLNSAREKQSSLINNENDYFFISIGSDKNSGYLCSWDENSEHQQQLVLFGLSLIVGYFARKAGEDVRVRKDFLGFFVKKIFQENNTQRNLENLLLLFKNKFCLCIYAEKERSVEVLSSGDLSNDEIIAFLVYTFQSFLCQIDSEEERLEFFKKILSMTEEVI